MTQRYVQKLNDEETQLATLKKESDELAEQQDKAQQELNTMIESLSMDVTL